MWAREHFGKPLPATTVHHCIHISNLQRHTPATCRNTIDSTARLCCGLSPCFRLLLEITDVVKEVKGPSSAQSSKASSCAVWPCVSAHGVGNPQTCEGTINERYIRVLEQHMLPSRYLFLRHLCLFQQDGAKTHSARVTTVWLNSKRVGVLDWPAVVQTCLPLKTCGTL